MKRWFFVEQWRMSINERHCILCYVYSVAPHNFVWCNNMKIKNKWFSNGVLGIPLFRFVERITKKYKCIIFTSFFCSLHLIHTKTTSSTHTVHNNESSIQNIKILSPTFFGEKHNIFDIFPLNYSKREWNKSWKQEQQRLRTFSKKRIQQRS